MQLVAAFTSFRPENIACHAGRVYPHKNRLVGLPFSFDEGNVLQAVGYLSERNQSEMSVCGRHIDFRPFLDERFLFETVGDEIAYRDDFDTELPGFFEQLGHTCHCTVFVHDFYEGGGRV